MPILIAHPHPHSPLCPNPCLAITLTQLPSAWAKARKDHPHCKWLWAGCHWGSEVLGQQGDKWHRENIAAFLLVKPQPVSQRPPCVLLSQQIPQISLHLCQQGSITSSTGDTAQRGITPCMPSGHPAWLMHAANSELGCHNSSFSMRFLHSVSPRFTQLLLMLGFASGFSCLFSRNGRKGNI